MTLRRAFCFCYVRVQSGTRGPRQIAKGSARSQKARHARAVLHPNWGRPRSRRKRKKSPARKTREERRLKGYTLAFKTTGQTKGGRRRVHWLQLWNPAFVWSLGVLIPIRVLKRTNSGKSVVCASEMPQAEDSPMVARACRQGGLPLKDAALQRIARSLCPKPLRCTGLARAQEQRASGART